ncbi:hypothetical protein BKI52_13515 [marine bacterium AO1-C]|nr:hypothetical protein BKI52_13515 [marine bacterium AO1-C]
MHEKEYFAHLYEIASHLNKEFSLQAALNKALGKIVHLLNLETGWIWLVQNDNQSVYLAATYNLPPALAKHPERLSGWCYCIEKYLSNDYSEPCNVSEIICTRLKNIKTDTHDLKFHATVPLFVNDEIAGLLNLLSKESQQLSEEELSLLNTISELIGMAIQRTRLQESFGKTSSPPKGDNEVIERIFQPRLEALLANLQQLKETTNESGTEALNEALAQVEAMQQQLTLMKGEFTRKQSEENTPNEFYYPASPLTERELEVLQLVRKGDTNKQIAEKLFISERTVKFHISSIMSKLYAETRTQAVDIALRRGLLGL